MGDRLGHLVTWTTYGTWLRGDERGRVDKRRSTPRTPFEAPDRARRIQNLARMTESPVVLSPRARRAVDAAPCRTCAIKACQLFSRGVRGNHVHDP